MSAENGPAGEQQQRLYERLAEVPLLNETAHQAMAQYTAGKNYSALVSAALAAVETAVQAAATKADQLELVRHTVATLSLLACKGLDQLESRYPSVKTVDGQQLKQVGQKYWQDSYFKHGIDTVSNAKNAGVDKVEETKGLVVSKVNGIVDYGNAAIDGTVNYVDALVDSYIAEPTSASAQTEDDKRVVAKVQNIGGKMVNGLKSKASRHADELRVILVQNIRDLHSAMAVIEYFQAKASWATTSASENINALKGNAASLLAAVQLQADQHNIKPEVLLLRVVKATSSVLATASNQIITRLPASYLPDTYANPIRSFVAYLQHMDDSFAQAQSLHDVKEDVVTEAKDKIGSWEPVITDAFDRIAQYVPVSWLAGKTATELATVSEASTDGALLAPPAPSDVDPALSALSTPNDVDIASALGTRITRTIHSTQSAAYTRISQISSSHMESHTMKSMQ